MNFPIGKKSKRAKEILMEWDRMMTNKIIAINLSFLRMENAPKIKYVMNKILIEIAMTTEVIEIFSHPNSIAERWNTNSVKHKIAGWKKFFWKGKQK